MEVPVLLIIFGFIAAMTVFQNRAKERRDRLKVLEEAIRSGNLDPAMKQELVGELTGRKPGQASGPQPAPSAERHGTLARIAFAGGWLGLFLGIGLIAMDDRDGYEAGVVIAAISFAFVTLPIAIKELERERPRGRRATHRS